MTFSGQARGPRALAALLILLSAFGFGVHADGQPAPTPSPTPAAPSTPTPSPSPSDSAATGQIVELAARPVATTEGKATREEVYSAIMASLAAIRAELDKANIKPAGNPLAVFLEADDAGFKYRAEIPIAAAPEGKSQLSDAIKLGQSPVGRAMKFEHRGDYDEIDYTYEAITAFLDEKGVDAQDVFIEEYLNLPKTGDDPNLQVDIFVLIK